MFCSLFSLSEIQFENNAHFFFILLTGHLMVFIFDIEYVCNRTYRKKTNSITNQTTTTTKMGIIRLHISVDCFAVHPNDIKSRNRNQARNSVETHSNTHTATHMSTDSNSNPIQFQSAQFSINYDYRRRIVDVSLLKGFLSFDAHSMNINERT